jgi:hypothetical protein
MTLVYLIPSLVGIEAQLQCSFRLALKNIIGLSGIEQAETLQQAIDSQSVSDTFLVATENHFVLKPTKVDEFAIHRSRGKIRANERKLSGHAEIVRQTFKTLADRGYSYFDYGHQIACYQKSKLASTLSDFAGLLTESVYPNHHGINPVGLRSSWFKFIVCSSDWGVWNPAYICLQAGRFAEHKARLLD